MIKNYLILAFRNLTKRKVYSFINIAGLAIGVAVCLVILNYVDFELSYDSFHENAARIYRTNTTVIVNGEHRGTNIISSFGLGPALLSDIPEVESYVRTHPMYGGAAVTYKRQTAADATSFHEEDMYYVDSTFFKVFTYKALQGNLDVALQKPSSIVLTRKMADKYFKPGEQPIGQMLNVSGGWADGDYEVTAILDDIPQNSHFSFDFLMPTHNLLRNNQYQHDNGWGWNNFVTYVQFHPNTNVKAVDAKMPAFVDKYQGKDLASSNSKNIIGFQPVRDIHLSPGLNFESSQTVSINTIYFFVLIGVFILAIAWVNYINLSTARAMERAREVGIKKSIGAYRTQLITQFLFESVLINFISIALAALLAVVLLPVLGGIVDKNLNFNFSDYRFWLVLFGLFAIGSFISGIYPAFVLSSFNITEVIKGKIGKTKGFTLRKALVVFQFCASLILIAGTFTIYRQIVYMRNEDKGLTMDQMLIVNGPSVYPKTGGRQALTTLKNEIKKLPGVVNVTTSGAIPGGGYNWGTGMRRMGTQETESKNGNVVWVDPDFVDTYGIKVLAGHPFNIAVKSDMESVLVNEAALKAFGLGTPEHALEEKILLGGDTVNIVGVLKNYHWNSLKTDHSPWLLKADSISGRCFSVLLAGKNIPEVISKIESHYREIFPGNPFDYKFLDDFFNSQYKAEVQFAQIFSLFAILAIVIACLGLWGLASFTTAQKLKEIGIRKVLGASVQSIVSMLSWQFLKLVLISSVIGIPLTYWAVGVWLSDFAFRIDRQVDLFLVPLLILSIIAVGTVSVQIMRGAMTNPAKILKSE